MTTAKLIELEAKATDEPWGVGMRNGANANSVYSYTGTDSHDDPTICSVYGINMHRNKDEVKDCAGYPNAELIAYLRNHAQDFIRLLEAAEYFANEYQIAEDAGELQHWPENEAEKCKAVFDALAAFKEKS